MVPCVERTELSDLSAGPEYPERRVRLGIERLVNHLRVRHRAVGEEVVDGPNGSHVTCGILVLIIEFHICCSISTLHLTRTFRCNEMTHQNMLSVTDPYIDLIVILNGVFH